MTPATYPPHQTPASHAASTGPAPSSNRSQAARAHWQRWRQRRACTAPQALGANPEERLP